MNLTDITKLEALSARAKTEGNAANQQFWSLLIAHADTLLALSRAALAVDKPLHVLWIEQCLWSQATFGADDVIGPVPAIKHLALEVSEAMDAPHDKEEYADCLLLLMDAARRAGIGLESLIAAAADKFAKNKLRQWAAPDADGVCVHLKPNSEAAKPRG